MYPRVSCCTAVVLISNRKSSNSWDHSNWFLFEQTLRQLRREVSLYIAESWKETVKISLFQKVTIPLLFSVSSLSLLLSSSSRKGHLIYNRVSTISSKGKLQWLGEGVCTGVQQLDENEPEVRRCANPIFYTFKFVYLVLFSFFAFNVFYLNPISQFFSSDHLFDSSIWRMHITFRWLICVWPPASS